MPFKSDAQRRWMYSQKPAMAKRWSEETPRNAKLPERVAKKTRRKSSLLTAFEEGGKRLRSRR